MIEQLKQLKPLNLQSVALMRRPPQTTSIEEISAASAELVAMTNECARLCGVLSKLPAVPAQHADDAEGFAL